MKQDNHRTKNISRNLLWGCFSKFISLGLSFITYSVIIYAIGIEYVGLGSLFSSVLQVLSFAELGIGSALVFNMYKPIAEENNDKVCALLNFYRKVYRLIGIIVSVLGFLIMFILKYLIAGDIPSNINIQVLFSIYLINNVLGYFLFAHKRSLFIASQRIDVINKVSMIVQVGSNLVKVLCLILARNYYIYTLIIPISTLVESIFIGFLANKYYPQLQCRGEMTLEEKNFLYTKVKGILFQKIGNIVLFAADTIVISAFLGLRILGIYNSYYYVIQVLASIMGIFQTALIPSIGNSIVLETVEKNLKDFYRIHLVYLWIVIWFCSCMFCLYQPFMSLWVGSDNMLPDYMIALFVIYFFVYKMGDVCWMYSEAIGLWWEGRFVSLLSSILNLSINIVLVNLIGLAGILLSTIISLTFISNLFGVRILFSRYYHGGVLSYFLYNGFYFFSMCIVTALTYFICYFVHVEGVFAFLLKVIICIICPNSILLMINYKNPKFISLQRMFKKER